MRPALWGGLVAYGVVASDAALTMLDTMATKFSRKKPVLSWNPSSENPPFVRNIGAMAVSTVWMTCSSWEVGMTPGWSCGHP